MANSEQLQRLMAGVQAWNDWYQADDVYYTTTPNLSGANLRRADLSGANLSGANLSGANLSGADLRRANLRRADLRGANLIGADLRRADLRGANLSAADLSGANLRRADLSAADLSGANLSGANLRDANLSGANLRDANLSDADLSGANIPEAPAIERLDAKILAAIESPGCALEMQRWHTCETTHCRAGWAIVVSGEEGRQLEKKYGPAVAGALIYHASTGRVPDFHRMDNDAVLADIREQAALQIGGGE